MSENDKYPEDSGRRRFVKGVVGSGSLSALGAIGAVSIDLTTAPTGEGGGATTYFGVENTAGPAPRGMPLIPIEIDDEGFIRGIYPEVREVTRQGRTVRVVEQEVGGTTYSIGWFQFCGVQSYEGLQPDYDAEDNYFRYVANSSYEWQNKAVDGGARVNVADFDDYETWGNGIGDSGVGKPGAATWRSQNAENSIPIQLIRSTRIAEAAESAGGAVGEFLSAATDQGMMAIMNKCTHFCCVPGFKATPQSEQFAAADDIYCPCHQSVYDPFSVVELQFTAFPRPEGE